MATKPALKIKITTALPVDDVSPEAIAKASGKVREIIVALSEKGFIGNEAVVRVGNIRVPA
jgi:hypothetical protein